jgi:hypothetical protein
MYPASLTAAAQWPIEQQLRIAILYSCSILGHSPAMTQQYTTTVYWVFPSKDATAYNCSILGISPAMTQQYTTTAYWVFPQQ